MIKILIEIIKSILTSTTFKIYTKKAIDLTCEKSIQKAIGIIETKLRIMELENELQHRNLHNQKSNGKFTGLRLVSN